MSHMRRRGEPSGDSKKDGESQPPQPKEIQWEPKTRLGRQVRQGEIVSIEEVFAGNQRIQELEIIDYLVPGLEETILDVRRVQRQTDAGKRTSFQAFAVVGNRNGLVGVASGKDTSMGTAIRNAIKNAKLSLSPVRRGCGSWECACSDPHSIPLSTRGKTATVVVKILPGPRGLGLVVGSQAKKVLRLAGVSDVWSKTSGDTRTTGNYVSAVFEALKATFHVQDPADW